MPKSGNGQAGKDIIRVTQISRRQFFQGVGVRLGGAMIGGIALASACGPENTSTTGTETGSSTRTTNPTTPPATTPTSAAPTTQTTIASTTAIETQTTSAPTPVVTDTAFSYSPPSELPPLIAVPNSSCTIATDRLYSLEHIWVKRISSDHAVLGITPSLVAILYEPYSLALPEVGKTLARDDAFGVAGGWKTVADLISPISGTVVFMNEPLARLGHQAALIGSINYEPYTGGWMVVIKMDKPGELDDLMTPEGYLERLT